MSPDHSLAGRRVLLTGATGFLGSHLASELVRVGADIHALRRSSPGETRLPCEGVKWHWADLTEPESLRGVMAAAQPEIVFHLAAYGTVYGEADEDAIFQVNVVGTWNLWQALDGHRCRFVHVGSCGEYGEASGPLREDCVCRPQWFYPATKHAATVLLSTLGRRGDREVVILRPFGPYGPGDNPKRVVPHTILTLLRGDIVKVTPGEQLRDYSYVSDHVAAMLSAAVQPLPESGRIYNIGSGRVTSLRQVIETVARAVGENAIDRVRFGALPYRSNETWEMYCDIAAARRDLDWEPRVSLDEGIEHTVQWYRNEFREELSAATASSGRVAGMPDRD